MNIEMYKGDQIFAKYCCVNGYEHVLGTTAGVK